MLLSAVKNARPKPLVASGAEFGKGVYSEPYDSVRFDHPDNIFHED